MKHLRHFNEAFRTPDSWYDNPDWEDEDPEPNPPEITVPEAEREFRYIARYPGNYLLFERKRDHTFWILDIQGIEGGDLETYWNSYMSQVVFRDRWGDLDTKPADLEEGHFDTDAVESFVTDLFRGKIPGDKDPDIKSVVEDPTEALERFEGGRGYLFSLADPTVGRGILESMIKSYQNDWVSTKQKKELTTLIKKLSKKFPPEE
jgi:hypothetical protein